MSLTVREFISQFRNELKEVSADSIYTNKFLYAIGSKHAKWIIRREWSSNKLFRNKALFTRLPCVPTKEVDKIEECVVKGIKLYRTECKIPQMWEGEFGPLIKRVASIDNYTEFKVLSSAEWENKAKSPYLKMTKEHYCYWLNGYLYFPKDHPKRILVEGMFKSNLTDLCDCEPEKPCQRFLDTEFSIPSWIIAEVISKSVQEILGQTSRILQDEAINKNPNIRN